jgi:hypothetical protein
VVAALKKPGNQASFEKAYFQIVHHLTPIFATGHITAAAVDGGARGEWGTHDFQSQSWFE